MWCELLFALLFLVGFLTSPSCNCCGDACVLFEDIFDRSDNTNLGGDWAELLEDWEISGNKLTVGAADAAVQCQQTFATDTFATTALLTSSASGDQVRLCNQMFDEDNYLAAELEFGAPGALRLIRRASGSDTIVAEFEIDLTPSTEYLLNFCTAGGQMTATLFTYYGARLTGLQATTTGIGAYYAGLATGTLTGTATIDSFTIETLDPDCQECTPCVSLPLTDDFSALSSNWESFAAASVGGELELTDDGGTGGLALVRQCVRVPEGTGWVLTVTVDLVDFADRVMFPGSESHVVQLQLFNASSSILFEVRWAFQTSNNEYRYLALDGGGSTLTSAVAGLPPDGVTMKIVVTENAGNYDVEYYIDTTLIASHTGAPPWGSTGQFLASVGTGGGASGSDIITLLDNLSLTVSP